MAKVSLAEYLREHCVEPTRRPEDIGPFVTISRQYGCYGFSLALLLQELLNSELPPSKAWKVYNREILERLACQTHMAADLLESLRHEHPSLVIEFFRGLSGERVPSAREVRHRIGMMIRGLAICGYAIIVGQGGAGATTGLPNGLSIRLEAPEDWRLQAIVDRMGISPAQARKLIERKEAERDRMRRVYEAQCPRTPAFHIVYDCSVLTLAQIATHVAAAMRLRGLIT